MSDFEACGGDGDFGASRNDASFSEDDDSFDMLAQVEDEGAPALGARSPEGSLQRPSERSPESFGERSPESFADRFEQGLYEAEEAVVEGEMSDEYEPTGEAGEGATAAAVASPGPCGEELGEPVEQGLEDLLCLQDPPSPLPSPRTAATPARPVMSTAAPSSTQALRRSPRLAGVPPPPPPEVAAAAAAASRMSAASAKKVGVSLFGGGSGGEGCGNANGVTPYSSRRGRRGSQKFQAFTPGSAFGDAMDDQNASFR